MHLVDCLDMNMSAEVVQAVRQGGEFTDRESGNLKYLQLMD